VLRRLGEPNGGQDHGSHQLAAVPQSVLRGGSPKSRGPLLVFRAAYRSDTHARQATFGRLRIPLVLSVVRSGDDAHGSQMQTHAPTAVLNSEINAGLIDSKIGIMCKSPLGWLSWVMNSRRLIRSPRQRRPTSFAGQ
jgi:hypothetical protein